MDGYFIPLNTMSDTAQETFAKMMKIISKGGQVDVVARCDGKEYRWECDGLKYAAPVGQQLPNVITPAMLEGQPASERQQPGIDVEALKNDVWHELEKEAPKCNKSWAVSFIIDYLTSRYDIRLRTEKDGV